jgi:MFS family permease
MLLSFLGPAIHCAWGVRPASESLLSSVVFVGMLAGVYVLGLVSDQYGRRRGFLASALLLGAAAMASAAAPSFGVSTSSESGLLGPPQRVRLARMSRHLLPTVPPTCADAVQWLLALRGVVGFALGGAPIAVTLFAEFCTTDGRGRWLLVLQAAWTIGACAFGPICCPVANLPTLLATWLQARCLR